MRHGTGHKEAQDEQRRARARRPAKVPAFEEWAEGKPLLFAMLAHVLAMSAEPFYEMCELARQGENVEGGHDGAPLDVWLRQYGQGERVVGESLKVLASVVPKEARPEDLLELRCLGADWLELSAKERKEALAKVTPMRWRRAVEQAAAAYREMWDAHLDRVRAEIAGEVASALTGAELLAGLGTPEVRFFFRVWLPCWLEYGKSAEELLREARAGDMRGVEDLLRLDKRAFDDRGIRKVYRAAQVERNKVRVELFHRALESGPRGSVTLKGVKVLLAALIHKTAQEWDARVSRAERKLRKVGLRPPKAKLSAPGVRRLFDAVAKDCHGLAADPDLSQAPHGFYMAVKRAREFWPDGLVLSQRW